MRRLFCFFAAVAVLSSCAKESYIDNGLGEHFYSEARDVFFYNGTEALSRAVRWNSIDTITDPELKDAMSSRFLDGMRVFRNGNILEIGSLNYDTGGKGLFEEGSVWTVTNDYCEDFTYTIEYAGGTSWNVSIDASLGYMDYDNNIKITGELFLTYVNDEIDPEPIFRIVKAQGKYMDDRSYSEGVGSVDITVEEQITLVHKSYDEFYTPIPLKLYDYAGSGNIHLFGGKFKAVLNTLPDNELNNEVYIFDLSFSNEFSAEVYVSHNGVWQIIS